MSLNSTTMHKQNKIKRSDLVDQLRDHQVRSKYNWASVSYFSSNANLSSSYSRMDMMMFVLWELLILAFIVSSAVTKQAKLNRKNKRRMLLPLS
ncbi:hypothetical protein Ccrd_013904, partial [Cynara cardunculus var. scolymus]